MRPLNFITIEFAAFTFLIGQSKTFFREWPKHAKKLHITLVYTAVTLSHYNVGQKWDTGNAGI